MVFGQVVIGPAGSGKSTYCNGLGQFFKAVEREYAIVNLDPANDSIPYVADIDLSELVSLKQVMDEFGLGPNGGLIYCMEYLETNIEWLLEKLDTVKDKYLIFDCPGQVELFTNHHSLKNIIERLQKLNIRLCIVNLVDAHHCVDPSRYVSMLMVSLRTMLQFGCPHINILSKVDLMEAYGTLDYYTQVQDLSYLLERLDNDSFTKKYKSLNAAICELVEDFGLVGFLTLCVEDKESILHVVRAIDKANGFVFGGLDQGNESIFETADRWEAWDRYNHDVQEKYLQSTEPEMFQDIDLEKVKEFLGPIKEHQL